MDNSHDDLPMSPDEQQVAWIRTPYHAPILDSQGNSFGTTESLLGDEAEDIFHGLAVKLASGGRVAEVAADHVTKITLAAVHTDLDPASVEQLPAYQEERWFHLGEGGLFRKHAEWKRG
ncbi:MAG: hypothetical protein ACYCX9_03400 [Candidatus Dormibacteria bacterium]|jgi:hypothetical protein